MNNLGTPKLFIDESLIPNPAAGKPEKPAPNRLQHLPSPCNIQSRYITLATGSPRRKRRRISRQGIFLWLAGLKEYRAM